MKNQRNTWLNQKDLPAELQEELLAMEQDPQWCHDAFYRDLEFGTSGLRGIMGAGTNRMNLYVVRKVTQGLADYIWTQCKNPAVAIGYDSRIHSNDFAKETASVLCANGIRVYMFPVITPVAALSYAVRELDCFMGVMITASHNPKEYNGYKVYDKEGCQITGNVPEEILKACESVHIFEDVKRSAFEKEGFDFKKAGWNWIEEEILEGYSRCALEQQLPWESPEHMQQTMQQLKVVYTPLNGAGRTFVEDALQKLGVKNLFIPESQAGPDGNFPTCPYPNPEKREAYEEAIALCTEIGGDFILATDPDCDRVGVAVPCPEQNTYRLLTGNELGALLFDFICHMRTESKWAKPMPENPIVARSLVSTPLIDKIAEHFNVEVKITLTGFKYICRFMGELESRGQAERFIFGFEESNGYLTGNFTRDKDGVSTAVLVCQMAAWHKARGCSLPEALNQIYTACGWYKNESSSVAFEGYQGAEAMKQLMESLRSQPVKTLCGTEVTEQIDYKAPTAGDFPAADMLQLHLADGSSCIIRPSGTEPKLKIYTFVWGREQNTAQEKSRAMNNAILAEIKKRKTV